MKSKALYRMVFTALMAAIVFVSTMFLKIDLGFTMVKTGNIFCLFSGMLLGGVYGGLAAGIGSMIYDLFDPRFAAMAYTTLINFFAMGCVCGVIAHMGGKRGTSFKQNVLAAVCGSLTYLFLYLFKNILTLTLGSGEPFSVALVTMLPKLGISAINAVIAVVFSVMLAKPLMSALDKNCPTLF